MSLSYAFYLGFWNTRIFGHQTSPTSSRSIRRSLGPSRRRPDCRWWRRSRSRTRRWWRRRRSRSRRWWRRRRRRTRRWWRRRSRTPVYNAQNCPWSCLSLPHRRSSFPKLLFLPGKLFRLPFHISLAPYWLIIICSKSSLISTSLRGFCSAIKPPSIFCSSQIVKALTLSELVFAVLFNLISFFVSLNTELNLRRGHFLQIFSFCEA